MRPVEEKTKPHGAANPNSNASKENTKNGVRGASAMGGPGLGGGDINKGPLKKQRVELTATATGLARTTAKSTK
jgi:hypothetical protein